MENPKIKELISTIDTYIPEKEINTILAALNFSQDAHNNQKRKSGEPFINHPIEVSKILASIKLDSSSIVSGLLHDTIEDTEISIKEIDKNFGEEVANLVQGLTKINHYLIDKFVHLGLPNQYNDFLNWKHTLLEQFNKARKL